MQNISILRSKRKTISLSVSTYGEVVLRIPLWLKDQDIQKIIQQKTSWIERQLGQLSTVSAANKQFVPGETFVFLGNPHQLQVSDEYFRGIKREAGEFIISRYFFHKAKGLLQDWYKDQAVTFLEARIAVYVGSHNFSYTKLRITGAKTRWGSCSGRGTISFSWRLLQLPAQVIEYVVVHELAHTKFPNHSKYFWALVASLYPDFVSARRILRSFHNTW